jgi:hypothetical protein
MTLLVKNGTDADTKYVTPEVYKDVHKNDINEVVFQDPFGDDARKAKRNLVAAGFGSILVAVLQLKVNGFLGLQTKDATGLSPAVTSGLACLVVIYFLVAFVFAAFVDYSAWKFKRERYLIRPYLDLIAMLENNCRTLQEQIKNATMRLNGLPHDNDMQSQVHYSKTIELTLGQLQSIQTESSGFYSEVRPLLESWAATVKKANQLSWRLRARFVSLWALDILLPVALAGIGIYETAGGLREVVARLVI